MRGKKQIAAVVLAVIFAVTAGIPHSTVYAEPDSNGNAQAADAAADDTKKEEKKEEDMTPKELEKKAEEDAYKMEIQSNSWKNWPQGNIRRSSDRDGCRNRKYLICEEY